MDQEIPQHLQEQQQQQTQQVDKLHRPLLYHNRGSSSSPQLHSSLKKYKMGERSSDSRRRVSFPKDANLITGYLEPIDPWATITIVTAPELLSLYRQSCSKHGTEPLPVITEHLDGLDLSMGQRVPLLSLKDQNLSHGSCEALEEIFKRVQYRSINLSHAGLDDTSASVLFDMIEYYEATNELDVSDNLDMTNKCWLACINMVKKSQALNVLIMRGPGIADYHATNLAKALNTSALHTLRLEHCELSCRPLATLCNLLKRNTVLKELSLAHNQLTSDDAKNIAGLLRSNYHIQLLDISNNEIGDKGVEYIISALIEQSIYFKTMQETKRKSDFSFSDLSSSLNSINSNKHYFPYGRTSHLHQYQGSIYGVPSHQLQYHQQHQQQQQHVIPPQVTETKFKKGAPPLTKPSTPPPPLMGAGIPMTPPPTPALPSASPPVEDDVFLTPTKLSPPVVEEKSPADQQEPPPQEPPPTNVEISAVPSEQQAKHDNQPEVKSTNIDSGINSSVSSDVEQTNSDSSNKVVDLIDEQQPTQKVHAGSNEEENHLVMMASAIQSVSPASSIAKDELSSNMSMVTNSDTATINDSDKGDGILVGLSSVVETETVTEDDSGGGSTKVPDGGGSTETLELTFALDHEEDIKGAKKARLAKQDSVLSEFESSIPEVKPLVKVEIVKNVADEEPMDEDTPEICADYDDDKNLKILEENLLVDRSINASSVEQIQHKKTKDNGLKGNKSDSGKSAPMTPLATFKKDELQLLLDKSKQQEEQEEFLKPIDIVPLAVTTTIVPPPDELNEDSKIPDISSTSAPEKLETIPLKIVEDIDIKEKPLSRSLDSTGTAEFEGSFLGGSQPPLFSNERSFSSESLNSETSVDSNDSKSSLKIIESKFAARNGTLERQQSLASKDAQSAEVPVMPGGLQVLVLWKNEITRNTAQNFSDLIENTSTLEILNIGCNLLCNDFVAGIKSSLKGNSSLTNLGLQGAHLSDNGAKVMAEVIEFGGNSTLQRIDLRNNNILATGLDYLNEALKSNKTVTRIDLDDIPKRALDNSLEVGQEYGRLLNNIRAQCERNKHPPEPSEPISTSIKRVRATHLNSRKISLTCTTLREAAARPATGDKHHHLLDPTKKSGGRLRSPSISPIPSPGASPVPSPSRNRFQVTRVGESSGSTSSLSSINNNNNTSTSPSPSSTGSSPTLFFAANSRFRVVTVEEPSSSQSSPVANYPLGRMSSSSMSPSPLATGGISRIPPVSSSCSAPALSSFASSPKTTSSPISLTVTTNTTPPPVLVQSHLQQQPLQQQHIQSHFPPPLVTTPPAPPIPKSKHTRLPSASSALNDSIISSSTLLESPDLEVKRFMSGAGSLHASSGPARTHSANMDDSYCSSISSSIDSMDNVNYNNTSISSTDESFDLVVSSPSSSSKSVGSVSTAPLVKAASTTQQQEDSTLIAEQLPSTLSSSPQLQPLEQLTNTTIKEAPSLASANLLKVKNNSLSSLEMSTSSQESLFDVQDLSSVSSSGGSSSLVGGGRLAVPANSGNSNESTLTSIQSLEKDKSAVTGKQLQEKPARVRKSSWIASIGNHPRAADTSSLVASGTSGSSSSSGYSPAIEKLLSIFSPSNLFSSNKSSPPSSDCGPIPAGATSGGKDNTATAPHPPQRKESPMGGLFQWSKSSKDEEKILKVNVSPDSTITPQSHMQPSSQLSAHNVDTVISSQLRAAENISSESTLTSKSLANLPAAPQPAVISTAATHPKVIFRLGDDYDESEDDIDTLTSKYGGTGGIGIATDFSKLLPHQTSLLGTSAGSTTTNSSGISISSDHAEGSPIPPSIMHTSHLGQLARDSLTTMFKNPSLTSQDSIRSMDSLTEMTEPVSQQYHHPQQQHQQQQHHQHTHHQQSSGDVKPQ